MKHKTHKNYHHRCVGKKCQATFKSLREWNDQHHLRHPKLTYSYYHGTKMFECGQCRKQFMNASQLNLHKHFHCMDRLHKRFASKCNHCYKWPEDLLRHIKIHLSTVYSCTQCSYSNKQKRLLQQHINIHTDNLPFLCQGCTSHFKHAMQHYRHEKATGHYKLCKIETELNYFKKWYSVSCMEHFNFFSFCHSAAGFTVQ